MFVNIAVVGPKASGKTSLCSRLTSHRFDNIYKETKEKTMHFLRKPYKGTDVILRFEDTEPSETLRTEVFTPKFWFEAGDGEEEQDDDPRARRKRRFVPETNPVGDRKPVKRDAVFLVFSLDSLESFEEAKELLSQLFVRLGFSLTGWKRAPIAVILIGNKSDAIGKRRAVGRDLVSDLIKSTYTHSVTIDPATGQLMCHITYHETSAKMGTGCDELPEIVLDKVWNLPSKAEVNTPDTMDGLWGTMLRRYEWARTTHQMVVSGERQASQSKKRVVKFMKPILKLNWLPKLSIPTIPVPERMKIFPHKMWFCFCLKKDPPKEDDEEDGEEEALLEAAVEEEEEEEEAESDSDS